MNLYKANFTTVIFCEDVDEAIHIARNLADADTAFAYAEDTVEEILSEDELPSGWENQFRPIENEEGSYSDVTIKDILRRSAESLALRKRINELEKELKELKTQQRNVELVKKP